MLDICDSTAPEADEAALEADDVNESTAEVALAAMEEAAEERVELERSSVGSVSVQNEVKPASGQGGSALARAAERSTRRTGCA